ncbi:MAG TPA: helix-turn-helix transcriptional regulator [Steroidobacteraceae bacterium]|nr:helix-turn-helix transcriptional regulator [Steroidobacteraceae bacterium]
MKSTAHIFMPQHVNLSLRKLGLDLQVARKERRLRVADLAAAASCSMGTVRRLEAGDPGVSIGVLAVVLQQLDGQALLGDIVRLKDSRKAIPPEKALPKRVRRPAVKGGSQLEVISISAAQFWDMKREAQARDQVLVRGGQVPQRSLYLLKSEDLQGAKMKWPDRSSSARGLRRQGSE